MINISQEYANKLLEQATELIVTLRSWGYHLDKNPVLKGYEADTGKQVPNYWSGKELSETIIKIREKNKYSEEGG